MKLATTSHYRLLITAVIVTLTAACNKSAPEQATSAQPPQAAAPEGRKAAVAGLSLVEAKITRNSEGKLVVQGQVKNTSSKTIDHAEAEFKLFDKNGVALGSVTPAVDKLQAGFSWNFETAIEQKDAVSATLVGFTGS